MTYVKSCELSFSIHLLYVSAFDTSKRCILLLIQLYFFKCNICSTEHTKGIGFDKNLVYIFEECQNRANFC